MENKIIQEYKDGLTLTRISENNNISRYNVTKILKKHGVYKQTKEKRHNVRKCDISQNDIKIIIDMWNDGDSTTKIGERFQCNKSTIRDILIENGIDTKRQSYNFKKYEHDETYFDKIDTEEKAYWLGFITADGHITKNNACLIISLELGDISHLERFKKDIKSTSNISTKENLDSRYNKKTSSANITICSSKICKELKNKGLNHNKSWGFDVNKIKESVPEKLIHHFIRGYFDGDGSIGIYTQSYDNTRPLYNFSIVGIEDLLSFIQDKLELHNIKLRYDTRTKCMYILKSGNKQDIQRIREYLYHDATIYLQRKYDIFEKI